jgi:hypothetical protein
MTAAAATAILGFMLGALLGADNCPTVRVVGCGGGTLPSDKNLLRKNYVVTKGTIIVTMKNTNPRNIINQRTPPATHQPHTAHTGPREHHTPTKNHPHTNHTTHTPHHTHTAHQPKSNHTRPNTHAHTNTCAHLEGSTERSSNISIIKIMLQDHEEEAAMKW